MEIVERRKCGPSGPTDPIRSAQEIERIKEMLYPNPRDYALFVVGINTAFRASDLTAIRVGDVRYLQAGDDLPLREKKTKKRRTVTLNKFAVQAIQRLLQEIPFAHDDDLLFTTVHGDPISTFHLGRMVKHWCKTAGIRKGNYSSHTLRKTFGYTLRMKHKVPLEIIQDIYGHSSGHTTLRYVAIQPEEIRAAYMKGL